MKKRNVFYAGGLQICFPGLGRIYLGNWWIGILQLLMTVSWSINTETKTLIYALINGPVRPSQSHSSIYLYVLITRYT